MRHNGTSTPNPQPGVVFEHEDFEIRATEKRLHVRFSWNDRTANTIRSLYGAHFQRKQRYWSLPFEALREVKAIGKHHIKAADKRLADAAEQVARLGIDAKGYDWLEVLRTGSAKLTLPYCREAALLAFAAGAEKRPGEGFLRCSERRLPGLLLEAPAIDVHVRAARLEMAERKRISEERAAVSDAARQSRMVYRHADAPEIGDRVETEDGAFEVTGTGRRFPATRAIIAKRPELEGEIVCYAYMVPALELEVVVEADEDGLAP
jgi:hypothetical protein